MQENIYKGTVLPDQIGLDIFLKLSLNCEWASEIIEPPRLNTYQSSFSRKVTEVDLSQLVISTCSFPRCSFRCNRKTARADILLYQYWKISSVAFGKQKVWNQPPSYYTLSFSRTIGNRREKYIKPIGNKEYQQDNVKLILIGQKV